MEEIEIEIEIIEQKKNDLEIKMMTYTEYGRQLKIGF